MRSSAYAWGVSPRKLHVTSLIPPHISMPFTPSPRNKVLSNLLIFILKFTDL